MGESQNDVIRHTFKCNQCATGEVISNDLRKYGCNTPACPQCGGSMRCDDEYVIQAAND